MPFEPGRTAFAFKKAWQIYPSDLFIARPKVFFCR
jgi:hypothetical protein